MKKIIFANWKMNASIAMLSDFAGTFNEYDHEHVDLVIVPPFPYIKSFVDKLQGSSIAIGAQNISQFSNGSYTGEVSGAFLSELGAKYVIVGHSERREHFHENDSIIAMKLKQAVDNLLIPVLCVGETLEQRQSGLAIEVIKNQLEVALKYIENKDFIIAYEPIWAVGTGVIATLSEITEIHNAIKELVPAGTKIIYGGSVKANNSKELFAKEEISGALVGGASLDLKQFTGIIENA
jgi:triosephosphate isomerase